MLQRSSESATVCACPGLWEHTINTSATPLHSWHAHRSITCSSAAALPSQSSNGPPLCIRCMCDLEQSIEGQVPDLPAPMPASTRSTTFTDAPSLFGKNCTTAQMPLSSTGGSALSVRSDALPRATAWRWARQRGSSQPAPAGRQAGMGPACRGRCSARQAVGLPISCSSVPCSCCKWPLGRLWRGDSADGRGSGRWSCGSWHRWTGKAQRGPSAVRTVVVALHEPAGQLRAPQLHLLHVGGQQLARVAKVTRRASGPWQPEVRPLRADPLCLVAVELEWVGHRGA
jgi:hypothetical protein